MKEIDLDTYGGEDYFHHLFIVWFALGGGLLAVSMINHGLTPKIVLSIIGGMLP